MLTKKTKKRFVPGALAPFALCCLLLSACSKDDDDVPGPAYQPRPATAESSPYAAGVPEYLPAPGQFINTPLGEPEATKKLIGQAGKSVVSLGGFGGYIVFGFDHSIMNREGDDFGVYGNAFDGFSEPGIVAVMQDLNGNGLPDDEWFELEGQEHPALTTIRDYQITYYNPGGAGKDIPWEDNQGNQGAVKANQYHQQAYYPAFADDQESITFTGTLLRNTKDINEMGWIVNGHFDWGYADSYSSEYAEYGYNRFDISNAAGSTGQKVELEAIDFIKVYTAQNTDGEILGEISTEIGGVVDLSLQDTSLSP